MSSPSGRRKYQQFEERRQAARSATPDRATKAGRLLDDGLDDKVNDDDDEETLQLKLAAIEARLKLKKLQQSKKQSSQSGSHAGDDVQSRSSSAFGSQSARPPGRFLAGRKRKGIDGDDEEHVQVALSPMKRPPPSDGQVSSKRVALNDSEGNSYRDTFQRPRPISRAVDGPRSQTPSRLGRNYDNSTTGSTPGCDLRRAKSFSERIAESRTADNKKREKVLELQRKRSSGFTLDKEEIRKFHTEAEQRMNNSRPASPQKHREQFTREDVLQSYNSRPNSALRRAKTTSQHVDGWRSQKSTSPTDSNVNSGARPVSSTSNREHSEVSQPAGTKAPDPSKFESFSRLHLSTRILPHSFLTRTLEGKTVMQIPDLLKTIKAPAFDPPDVDGDYVVFGIVASKSTPKNHQEKTNVTKVDDPYDDGSNNTSKYMVFTLTDLKWTIDLFLFATAFPRYYKLTPGTLIAILNPSIMPPPPHKIDTNRFSLTLSSSDDTILEIGKAQDLGFCKALRKDGKVCDSWVDGRKTDFCEFHVELQLRKTTSNRMEVNGTPSILGPGGRSGSRTGMFSRSRAGKQGLKQEGAAYDRESGSTYYVAPAIPGHRSASKLIDADDDPFLPPGTFQRGGQRAEDRLRARLAEQERERTIAKKLGEFGSLGSEYLRHKNQGEPPKSENRPKSKASNPPSRGTDNDAKVSSNISARIALGLHPRAKDAKSALLSSPSKRAPGRENDETKNDGGKKTRFITAKGIREAGRDSLGLPTYGADYDDDLDIV